MDKQKLRESAIILENLLNEKAKEDTAIQSLQNALAPFIKEAKEGTIKPPLEWSHIPGSRFFLENENSSYSDIESAFATFRIEITGVKREV